MGASKGCPVCGGPTGGRTQALDILSETLSGTPSLGQCLRVGSQKQARDQDLSDGRGVDLSDGRGVSGR